MIANVAAAARDLCNVHDNEKSSLCKELTKTSGDVGMLRLMMIVA